IPTGDVTVKMLFEADQPTPGTGGNVTLFANDKGIGAGRIDKTISLIFTTYAGMDMGRDNGGVVDLAYEDRAPYAFTGTVKKVVFDLKPADHESEQALHEHEQTQAVGAGAAG
ncbi:MAG: arylsulfatase, partial [Acidobacteriota bacterium]|nr:arylsulfatase [Acidobacteriota bacterium]